MRGRAPILLVIAALAAPVAVLAQEEQYTLVSDRPVLGRSALAEETAGRVLVRSVNSARYRAFAAGPIAIGSFIDARKGRIRIRVAAGRNTKKTWSATFFGGRFQLLQDSASPYLTTLRLVGGRFADICEQASMARVPVENSKRKVRRLWGDGKGRFRTSGRYSAATVRGTKWLLEDRCDGTLTYVARGEVEVEDFSDVDDVATEQPPASGGEGGGTGGQPQPAAGPQEDRTKSTRVRVKRGQRYVARPKK